MATLLNPMVVQYQCACKRWSPLAKLYFCRHCMVMRCGLCAANEVDSIYCPECLENMPSAEARLKKNRCGNCMDCPCCGIGLQTKAASLLEPGREEQMSPESGPSSKKVFYLTCLSCRWTSRDAGIPDQTSAGSNWPEKQYNPVTLLNNMLEHFRQLALIEKAERERKKYTKRRSHLAYYTDRYGIQALSARRRRGMGLSDKEQSATTKPPFSIEPSEEVEELPSETFVKDLRLDEITTILQRLCQPEYQPVYVSELHPLRKQLMVKRSQRCNQCDHNLCKAEFNPSSIKFKIQLCALFHVPEVRLTKPANLIAGKKQELFLTIINLTPALVHVALLPSADTNGDNFVSFEPPTTELAIPSKDETADFEEHLSGTEQVQGKSENSAVVSRCGHKLGIRLIVDVKPEQKEEDLWLNFVLSYDYMNTLLHLIGEQKEPEIVWLKQTVKLHLGQCSN